MKLHLKYLIIVFLILTGCGGDMANEGHDTERHEILAGKVIGQIAYNNPEYLTVGVPSTFEVRLSRNREVNP